MVKLHYDLHIHSCLSPCGDREMTPCNIVNMARLKGLDIIAVTDHNAYLNGKAAGIYAAQEQGGGGFVPMILYGAEVETAEEVHVLCLFASVEQVERFFSDLSPRFFPVKNDEEVYGEQLVLDENDIVLGHEERLLLMAAELSFEHLYELVNEHGGAFIPAHIDREAYSVLSNLGFLPQELPIGTVEISQRGIAQGFCERNSGMLEGYKLICSSDAHYLWDIAEAEHFLLVSERTPEAVIQCLRGSMNE